MDNIAPVADQAPAVAPAPAAPAAPATGPLGGPVLPALVNAGEAAVKFVHNHHDEIAAVVGAAKTAVAGGGDAAVVALAVAKVAIPLILQAFL